MANIVLEMMNLLFVYRSNAVMLIVLILTGKPLAGELPSLIF